MEYVYSIVIGYLLGSLPTAYILLKRFNNVNILNEGTKNVGAMNSYSVTKSKGIGLSVFIIDFIKGLLAVLIVKLFIADSFMPMILAAISAVFSHCYSPWIKFKGGRGLATGAGALSIITIFVLALWLLFWFLAYLFRKNLHFGNIAATILTGAIALSSYDVLNENFSNPAAETNLTYGVTVALIMIIIMSKHLEPLKEWFYGQRKKIKGNKDE